MTADTPVVPDEAVEAAARAIVREEFRQIGYDNVTDEQIDRGIGDDLVAGDDIRAQARAAIAAALPTVTAEVERLRAECDRIISGVRAWTSINEIAEPPLDWVGLGEFLNRLEER